MPQLTIPAVTLAAGFTSVDTCLRISPPTPTTLSQFLPEILGHLAVAALFRVQILSFFTKFPLSMASSVPQRNGETGTDPIVR